jgi:glutaredoxin 3
LVWIDSNVVGKNVPKIEIYSSNLCPFCWRAKGLLSKKGIDFSEILIDGNPAARQQMLDRAEGRTSVPQIFIDDVPIGGSDELAALDASGELDRLLQGAP